MHGLRNEGRDGEVDHDAGSEGLKDVSSVRALSRQAAQERSADDESVSRGVHRWLSLR